MVFIVEKTAYSPGRNNIVHTQIDVSYDLVCDPLDDHSSVGAFQFRASKQPDRHSTNCVKFIKVLSRVTWLVSKVCHEGTDMFCLELGCDRVDDVTSLCRIGRKNVECNQ